MDTSWRQRLRFLVRAGLMHTDEAGVPTWNRSYDITGDGFGEGSISTMLALPDGGFIVAGAAPALFYARVDAAGTMLWAKRIAGNFNIATDLLLLPMATSSLPASAKATPTMRSVIKADWTAPRSGRSSTAPKREQRVLHQRGGNAGQRVPLPRLPQPPDAIHGPAVDETGCQRRGGMEHPLRVQRDLHPAVQR
ncbi:MAG: hypothetical protein IPF64_17510 [Flavobacteriales bacterium]|nr:hypothetical protein [Flavobacteriales bacterium]